MNLEGQFFLDDKKCRKKLCTSKIVNEIKIVESFAKTNIIVLCMYY